jgi:hypothetical protein
MTAYGNFYITTAIPYVNAEPHLGHALELVQADAAARHRRLRGQPVRFLTGTDDHALKNVAAARAAGLAVREFVDANAARFRGLREPLGLSFDDFIRTSADARHRAGVEHLWRQCAERGDFYLRHYRGLYCRGCEQFYAPAELDHGVCAEHHAAPEPVAEQNWFFRLSRYTGRLLHALQSGRVRVEPATRRNEVLAFIRAGLADFSVSRPAARAHGWGIPVPGDPGQIIYVWWDALANYITALGYGSGDELRYRDWWANSGERVHVIGKGITRFHAVYWLALLLSAGQPLPTAIYVHEYLSADGAKLSKSAGNAVSPTILLAGSAPTPSAGGCSVTSPAPGTPTSPPGGWSRARTATWPTAWETCSSAPSPSCTDTARAGSPVPPAQPRRAPGSSAPARRSRGSSTTAWRGSTSAPPPPPSGRSCRPATASSRRSVPGSWPAVSSRAIARRAHGWTSCWASWWEPAAPSPPSSSRSSRRRIGPEQPVPHPPRLDRATHARLRPAEDPD